MRLKRWASGMRGARFHSRCRSPWSGWLKPPVSLTRSGRCGSGWWRLRPRRGDRRAPSPTTGCRCRRFSGGPWRWRGRLQPGGTAVQGVGTEPGALALVVRAESVGGKVSSLDLKWAAIRSMSVSWMRTRTCSAGRPMAVVLSVGLSPCWIARSLSGNAATGSKVVSVIRDNGVSSAGLRRCGLDVPGASNRISKLVGMVRRAQAARRCRH